MDSETLQDPVYKEIFDIVFRGNYAPGSRLVEEDLAKRVGVGRAKVRETLAKLVGQGLLVSGPKGVGVRIRSYSIDDVRQLFEFREILEGVIARGAAQMASLTDITRLEVICQKAREALAVEAFDEMEELDELFHTTIAQASRNKRALLSLRMLLAESRYLFFVYPTPRMSAEGRLGDVLTNHEALLEFIKARDDKSAEDCARKEMLAASERAIRMIISGDLESIQEKEKIA